MAANADEAAEVARKAYGVELSPAGPESVERVESILARLHEQHRARPFPKARLEEEAFRWGVFVGEAIRAVRPGAAWSAGPSAGCGAGPFLKLGEGEETYPLSWCYKRLADGPGDDVWLKFRMLILEREGTYGTLQGGGPVVEPGDEDGGGEGSRRWPE